MMGEKDLLGIGWNNGGEEEDFGGEVAKGSHRSRHRKEIET